MGTGYGHTPPCWGTAGGMAVSGQVRPRRAALRGAVAIAIPVAGLAAAVAGSRVQGGQVSKAGQGGRTGACRRHAVLAGVGSGGAAGLLAALIWPRRRRPTGALSTGAVSAARPDDRERGGAGLVAVVNTAAPNATEITDFLSGELPQARVVTAAPDDDLDAVLDSAARQAAALAVAGGDGTINAGAGAALRNGVPLLTVPAGTLNHFARAIGIESAADAVAAYRFGRLVRVGVGKISASDAPDRIFLNTAVFGAYPALADRRDRLRRRIGSWAALAVAGVWALRHAAPVEVAIDGKPHRVWVGFVGNGRYASWGALPTWRARLADGRLDVRLVLTGRHARRAGELAGLLLGPLRLVRGYRTWRTRTVRVEAAAPVRFAYDGEAVMISSAVTLTKHAVPLTVFQPD